MNQILLQKTVSTYEAKTHLSNLIVEVEHGASFLITKRGKAVAKIIPYHNEEFAVNFLEMADSLRKLRTGVKGKFDIHILKETGRKR